MKKIAYLCIGVFLPAFCSSVAGAAEFHDVISIQLQRINSFPESGSLIVLGSVLISGATILRRRKAARHRSSSL